MNGTIDGKIQHPHKHRNYKLLADPFLQKGVPKVYRYDGVVPGDNTYPPVIPRDPRNPLQRMRPRLEMDMPIPK